VIAIDMNRYVVNTYVCNVCFHVNQGMNVVDIVLF